MSTTLLVGGKVWPLSRQLNLTIPHFFVEDVIELLSSAQRGSSKMFQIETVALICYKTVVLSPCASATLIVQVLKTPALRWLDRMFQRGIMTLFPAQQGSSVQDHIHQPRSKIWLVSKHSSSVHSALFLTMMEHITECFISRPADHVPGWYLCASIVNMTNFSHLSWSNTCRLHFLKNWVPHKYSTLSSSSRDYRVSEENDQQSLQSTLLAVIGGCVCRLAQQS